MRIDVNEQIVIIISDREEKRNQLAQKFYNEAYVWQFAKIFFCVWVSEWVSEANNQMIANFSIDAYRFSQLVIKLITL